MTTVAPQPAAAYPGEPPTAAASSIASVADGLYYRLDPRVIIVNRISGAIFAAVVAVASLWGLAGAWLGALFNDGPAFWIAALGGPGWLVLVGLLIWSTYRLPEIGYLRESYCVDTRGIEIRRGIFWRSVINVPRSRVQHLDVSQGPLERRFGLGTLLIHTAGTQHSRVHLAGLEHGRALRLREVLLPTGAASDAV